MLLISTYFIGTFSTHSLAQQPIPANAQTKSILLVGGTAHIGNGTVLEKSLIGFKNGKLAMVKPFTTDYKNEGYEEIIDVSGKHIYPGIIAPNSTLGLVEIESVRATRDFSDAILYAPNIRAQIAYNTNSKITPTVRANGVLIAQVAPRSGYLSGTSCIMELDGWNWEDATLKADDGIHLNWPAFQKNTGWWAEPGTLEKNTLYTKQTTEIISFLENAKAYCAATEHPEKDLKSESLARIFNGTQSLFLHANGTREITDAILQLKKLNIPKIVLIGGKDISLSIDILKQHNIPVIVNRLHDLPEKTEDDINTLYKLPALLKQHGILFCLNNEGDMDAMNLRNLPFLAGTAAAYGLSKEEALSTITSNAAKILGIDTLIGSLEIGKHATLFVSEGDALDMRTNNVTHAYIQGKKIDLNTEQKQLYKIYSEKFK